MAAEEREEGGVVGDLGWRQGSMGRMEETMGRVEEGTLAEVEEGTVAFWNWTRISEAQQEEQGCGGLMGSG